MAIMHTNGNDGDEISDSQSSELEDDENSVSSDYSADDVLSDTSNSQVSLEVIDKGWNNPFWRVQVENVYNSMSSLPDDIDKMIAEPYFSVFSEKLREFYEHHNYMQRALYRSKLNDKINATVNYYEHKMSFDNDEAEEMAWSTRAFLFKKLLINNEDLFDKEMNRRV